MLTAGAEQVENPVKRLARGSRDVLGDETKLSHIQRVTHANARRKCMNRSSGDDEKSVASDKGGEKGEGGEKGAEHILWDEAEARTHPSPPRRIPLKDP